MRKNHTAMMGHTRDDDDDNSVAKETVLLQIISF